MIWEFLTTDIECIESVSAVGASADNGKTDKYSFFIGTREKGRFVEAVCFTLLERR